MYEDRLAEGIMLGQNSVANRDNNGWGNDGMAFLWILVILAMFGGFGNGFGGFGNNAAGLNGVLTRGDLCQDMNFNDLENGVRGISQGICDSTFALNNTMTNGFAGVQQTLCQGFNGVNTSILTSANETQSSIANLGFQLQQCCCDLRAGQADIKYALAQDTCALQNTMNNNTRDIITSQQAGTQRILDFLCQEKINGLQAENAQLTAQLSQNAQTNAIVSALSPKVPVPAYPVFAPNTSFAYPSGVSFGVNGNNGCGYGYNNSGCGCGCGCN